MGKFTSRQKSFYLRRYKTVKYTEQLHTTCNMLETPKKPHVKSMNCLHMLLSKGKLKRFEKEKK